MLSVVVLSDAPAGVDQVALTRDLAKTLASLVPFVVGNLIADAFVVTRPGAALDAIEQRSGCTVIAEASLAQGLSAALAAARRDTVLAMRPGFSLPPAFGDEIVEACGTNPGAAWFVRAQPTTLLARLLPGTRTPVALIAPVAALQTAARTGEADVGALARATRAKALRTVADRV